MQSWKSKARGAMKSAMVLQKLECGPGGWYARVPLMVVLLSVWSLQLRCSRGVVVVVHCMVSLWTMAVTPPGLLVRSW